MSFPIPYTLIRAKRKTIGIRIRKDGSLEVRAPRYVSVAEIEKVLCTRENWITEHQNRVRTMERTKWQYGTEIPYLGTLRTIVPAVGDRVGVTDTEIQIPTDLPDTEIPKAVIALYIKTGKSYLTAETNRLAEKYGLTVRSVTVNHAAKRWGSCTVQTGRIHYSWRLMCVPQKTIEYVITHELAHLRYPDHSPAFWQQVENWLADYEQRRAVLREYENYFNSLEGI